MKRSHLIDMLEHYLLPHTVIGADGTCPPHVVIKCHAPGQPCMQTTIHRSNGEGEDVYWDKVLAAAHDLFRPFAIAHFAYQPYYQSPYQVSIFCDYGDNRDTARDDGFRNFERVLWSIAQDPKDGLQLYAVRLLEQLYNHSVQGTLH